MITFVPVPSPSPPPPVEHPNSSYFTVAQLRSLFQPLQLTAPSGFILARTLVDILLSLLRSSSKDASLPLIWRDASKQQVQSLPVKYTHTHPTHCHTHHTHTQTLTSFVISVQLSIVFVRKSALPYASTIHKVDYLPYLMQVQYTRLITYLTLCKYNTQG